MDFRSTPPQRLHDIEYKKYKWGSQPIHGTVPGQECAVARRIALWPSEGGSRRPLSVHRPCFVREDHLSHFWIFDPGDDPYYPVRSLAAG